VATGNPNQVTGIVIPFLAAVVMPLLAREKRKLSTVTESAALRADAAELAVCAYPSVVALLGVGINGRPRGNARQSLRLSLRT
jgi:divalent metal cation (Fe/Co/Zn/Cd) transporter